MTAYWSLIGSFIVAVYFLWLDYNHEKESFDDKAAAIEQDIMEEKNTADGETLLKEKVILEEKSFAQEKSNAEQKRMAEEKRKLERKKRSNWKKTAFLAGVLLVSMWFVNKQNISNAKHHKNELNYYKTIDTINDAGKQINLIVD